MSTATAIEGAAPPKAGKKKLLIIVAAAVLALLLVSGGATLWVVKKRAQAEHDIDGAETAAAPDAHARNTRDPAIDPVFVPLDSFTVNLADRTVERYAQVGISLEMVDAKSADRVKSFMPAIRNNILMVLSDKRSTDLLERSGKQQLAEELRRATERALGNDPGAHGAADTGSPQAVRAVQFSNFIIQ